MFAPSPVHAGTPSRFHMSCGRAQVVVDHGPLCQIAAVGIGFKIFDQPPQRAGYKKHVRIDAKDEGATCFLKYRIPNRGSAPLAAREIPITIDRCTDVAERLRTAATRIVVDDHEFQGALKLGIAEPYRLNCEIDTVIVVVCCHADGNATRETLQSRRGNCTLRRGGFGFVIICCRVGAPSGCPRAESFAKVQQVICAGLRYENLAREDIESSIKLRRVAVLERDCRHALGEVTCKGKAPRGADCGH
jgi:hypothetical protein